LRERKDAARHLIHDRPMGIDELGGDKPELVNTDETLAEACAIYGIPVERLLRDLEAATTSERNGNT
jgi:hypothetical protein